MPTSSSDAQLSAAHGGAPELAATVLAPFVDQQTVLLATFRRDGTPVSTPVNIVVDGDRAYFRTWDTAGKLKRVRHTPEVTLAPSDARGVPGGPAIRARARVLAGAEADRAGALLSRKHPLVHGLLVPFIHRLRGNRTVHLELTPIAG